MFLAVKRLTIYYCTGTQQQEANVQTDSAWHLHSCQTKTPLPLAVQNVGL